MTESNIHPFGRWVRHFRREKDVYLRSMAEGLGISSAELSSLEMGYERAPTATVLGIVRLLELNFTEAQVVFNAAQAPLRDREADRQERDKAIAEGRAFVSYSHDPANPDCPCNECRMLAHETEELDEEWRKAFPPVDPPEYISGDDPRAPQMLANIAAWQREQPWMKDFDPEVGF